MLVSFRVKNFRSLVDRTLDMRYAEREGEACCDEQGCLRSLQDGEMTPRVVPVLKVPVADEADGEGMAEALRAFHLLACLMPLSPELRPALWQPNEQHRELKETEYSMELTVQGWLCRYTLAHNGEGILREELREDGELIYLIDHAADSYYFERLTTEDFPAERLRGIVAEECSDGDGHQIYSLLCRMSLYHFPEYQALGELNLALGAVQVFESGSIPADASVLALALRLNNENGENALREMASLMKKLDVGVEAIKPTPAFRDTVRTRIRGFKRPCSAEEPQLKDIAELIKVYRRTADGKKQPRLLRDEPAEIQTLFGLIGAMLSSLRSGDPLFIADLDRALPPQLLRPLIALFTTPAANKRGAQLLFTARNPELADLQK